MKEKRRINSSRCRCRPNICEADLDLCVERQCNRARRAMMLDTILWRRLDYCCWCILGLSIPIAVSVLYRFGNYFQLTRSMPRSICLLYPSIWCKCCECMCLQCSYGLWRWCITTFVCEYVCVCIIVVANRRRSIEYSEIKWEETLGKKQCRKATTNRTLKANTFNV